MPTPVALAALPGRQVNFRIEKKTKILKEFSQHRREQNRKKVLCKRFSTSCAACELLQRQPPTMDRRKPSTLSLSTKPRCSCHPYNTLNKASAVKYAYFPIHLSQQVQPQKAASSSIYNASRSVNSKARFQALHWQK